MVQHKHDVILGVAENASVTSAPDKTVDSADSLSHYAILAVDDEPSILQSLMRLFRREPYRFFSTTSAAEGLRIIAESSGIAVIISDQRMPEMSGSEFLARCRKLAPDAIRMLLTGYSDMAATIAAMNEGGATHYISKPWEESTLLQTVRSSVRQYHLILENRRQQEIINRQNEELSSWNSNLKERVLAQTAQIRKQMTDVRRLNQRQEDNSRGLVESMVALSELRDKKSRRHSAHTAALSVALAKSLGLPTEEVETIRIAALLHDIGKNALSDVELATDLDKFTGEELLNYRKHPVLGQTALDSIVDLRSAGLLIRHHHEWYDGSGFPDGLSGAAIPLGSALIALADRCDRETANYIGSNAVERVLEKLALSAGQLFDPVLLPHLENPAHDIYDRHFEHHGDLTELEALPKELKPGMILTRDLFSRSGMLLLQAWTELDNARIESLRRIFTIDPKPGGIHVAIRHHTR